MEATLLTDGDWYDYTCQNCGTAFESKSATAKFCSDKCKQANYQRKKKETVVVQQQVLEEQAGELAELQQAPIKRTQTVSELNPAWQTLEQACEVQRFRCKRLDEQLMDVEDRAAELTAGRQGTLIGMGVGIAGALVWMAVRYDNRRTAPLNALFIVTALILLVAGGLAGGWLGGSVHRQRRMADDRIAGALDQIGQEKTNLVERLKAEKARLDDLLIEQAQVPKYLGSTVTSVDEVRTTAAGV